MSNRNREIERIFVCIMDYSDVGQLQTRLESMRDDVWLSKTCCASRHGLRGVPSKRVDILIDQRLEANEALHPKGCIEFSVVRKSGRYDGNQRDRLAMRMMPQSACVDHERCYLSIAELPDAWRIDVVTEHGVVRWTRQYDRLRSDLSEYDPERLVMWHWTRYYQHLEHAVAEQTAKEWALTDWAQLASGWTLSEANRSASRALYRASREAGFRKMTLRAGPWGHPQSVLIRAVHGVRSMGMRSMGTPAKHEDIRKGIHGTPAKCFGFDRLRSVSIVS